MGEKDISLSVIIPVYQSSERIVNLLESLARQRANISFEVLIVDDASSDGTTDRIRDYLARLNTSNMYLFCLDKNEGPAAARNLAISKAKGQCFLLIDSDCFLLDDQHLEMIWEAHLENPHAVIGGGVSGRGKGYVAFSDRYCHWSTNIPGKLSSVVPFQHLVTAHLLIPRAVWETIGPFERIRTGEDTLFCLKAHQAKTPLRLRGDIVLGHYDREFWLDFIRCFYNCGKDREATRRLVYGKSPWFLSGPKFLRFLAIPMIAVALTFSHLKSWWPFDKRVVLALPGIFVGMSAMAYGVFIGRRDQC